jgi:hypothetical protein
MERKATREKDKQLAATEAENKNKNKNKKGNKRQHNKRRTQGLWRHLRSAP